MKVGFLVMNVGKNAGGPESYERALLQQFSLQATNIEFHLYCFVPPTEFIRDLSRKNFVVHDLSSKNRFVSLAFQLPRLLKRHGIAFFHAPFVPPPFTSTPYLFTHHCFSPYVHPEFYDKAILLRLRPLITRGLNKAQHTLCVSENVRRLSAEELNIPYERMSVVHNGVDSFFQRVPQTEAKEYLESEYNLTSPFFFFAGKLQKRKNINRILKSYRNFLDETDSTIKFALAGSRTWASDDLDEMLRKYDLESNVIELGYVPVDKLPYFYSACEAFVFATLWEGFGIPLIEAMACGAPVIASNLSSLPEIADGAAYLVDPYSCDEIANAMKEISRSPELKERLRNLGEQQARKFSWERCARETLEAYHEIFGLPISANESTKVAQ